MTSTPHRIYKCLNLEITMFSTPPSNSNSLEYGRTPPPIERSNATHNVGYLKEGVKCELFPAGLPSYPPPSFVTPAQTKRSIKCILDDHPSKKPCIRVDQEELGKLRQRLFNGENISPNSSNPKYGKDKKPSCIPRTPPKLINEVCPGAPCKKPCHFRQLSL